MMGQRSGGRHFILKFASLGVLALSLTACGRIPMAPVFHGSDHSAQSENSRNNRNARTERSEGPTQVTVQRGDTLSEIALRNNVPTRDLARANSIRAPFVIHVGQTLSIPGAPTHRVRRGESISVIAARYDMTTRELASANNISQPFTIYAGQELHLPWAAASNGSTRSTRSARTTTASNSDRPGFFERLGIGSREGDTRSASSTASSSQRAGRPAPRPRAAASSNSPTIQPTSVRSARSLTPPPRSGDGFMWPVDGRIISTYGPTESGQHNDGINISVPAGTPVLAADAGVVIYQGNQVPGYGSLILIRHSNGYVTAYAHNSRIQVRQGQEVARGEQIARSGRSGRVSEPQLHFEVRRNSDPVNPAQFLAGA